MLNITSYYVKIPSNQVSDFVIDIQKLKFAEVTICHKDWVFEAKSLYDHINKIDFDRNLLLTIYDCEKREEIDYIKYPEIQRWIIEKV